MFKTPRRAARPPARRGQALLEFVFVSVVLLGMAAAALTLGYFLYCAQSLQMFADVAAQEISRFPAEPGDTLRLGDPTLRRRDFDTAPNDRPLALRREFTETVYDEKHLVLAPEEYYAHLDGTGPALPVVNRLILPLFIYDPTFQVSNAGKGVMRYPGAIVRNTATRELTVLVPILEYGVDGSESLVRWVAPIEEVLADGESLYPVRTSDPSDKRPVSGIVALRMNYPAQSGMIVNRVAVDEKTFAVQVADDGRLAGGESLGETGRTFRDYELEVGANAGGFSPEGVVESRVHAGRFGLGRQAAHLERLGVRPYRKVLTAQAVYRRELFGTGG